MPGVLSPYNDNTKVAVIKACLYDPQINRSYADMAANCGTAIHRHQPASRLSMARVLDRLVHNAHRIDLNGESMRRTRKPGRRA